MFQNIKNSSQNIILIALSIILIYCFANDYIFDRKDKFFNLKDFQKHLNTEFNALNQKNVVDKLGINGTNGYSVKINDVDQVFKDNATETAIHNFWFTTPSGTIPSTERSYVFFSYTKNPSKFIKKGSTMELSNITDLSDSTLPKFLLEELSDGSDLKFYESGYISRSGDNVSISTSSTRAINLIRFNNGYCDIIINGRYLNVADSTYNLSLQDGQPSFPQFRRIELCNPIMVNYDANFYYKNLNIGPQININLQTLCEYKNNDYRFKNKTLRELSLKSEFNEKLYDYVKNGVSKVDSTLNNISDYLDVTASDPERLINRMYVQNVLDYKDFREDLMNKSAFQNTMNLTNSLKTTNLMNKVSDINEVSDKNIPGIDLMSGNSENLVFSEELIDNLFPQDPEDFYGLYVIKFSNFTLLDNIKILYNDSNFKIISKDNEEIINYSVKESKKLTIPEFPNQTILIKLKNSFSYPEKYDDVKELLLSKQRQLLNKIGVTNAVYLFGNDGKYALYNITRNKLFSLVKIGGN